MSSGLKNKRNRVVVRFKDGRLLKGYTHDFTPVKETFHLRSSQEKDTSEIRTADLKALFFVRTLEGNKDYSEKSRFGEVDNPHLRGLKIKLRFSDGEVMSGVTQGYSKKRKGFFLFPLDPRSNNERVYVLADALHDVKVGAAAEKEEPSIPRSYLKITGGSKDKVIEVPKEEIVVGRSTKCGIRLSAKTVSRNHAQLSFRNGEYSIEDLGSANGTYVNGKKVTECVLRNNDQIDMGQVRMLFYEGSAKRQNQKSGKR